VTGENSDREQSRASASVSNTLVPERLDWLRNIIVFILAAATLENLAVAVFQNVHSNISIFSNVSDVLGGFANASMEVFIIATYLAVTTLRYSAAMIASRPLFNDEVADGAPTTPRVALGILDALLNLLIMSLVFVSAQSLYPQGTHADGYKALELGVWIVSFIAIDTLLCALWLVSLKLFGPTRLGFNNQQAANTKSANSKWLVINGLEICCWLLFLWLHDKGASSLPILVLLGVIYLVVLLDFIFNWKNHWAELIKVRDTAETLE